MEKELFDLNFKELLKYPDKFAIKNRYDEPISCQGFCTCCENKLQRQSTTPPLMSHGCSIDEIKEIIPEPFTGRDNRRIMFLLENPGGDYQNGCELECNGFKKSPPVNHFYFSPNLDSVKWPTTVEEVNPNPYGNYFAYLIKRYSLNNVYITNCIKCKYTGDMYEKTKETCVENFLQREVCIFKPDIVFFFGHKAEHIFNDVKRLLPDFHGRTCYLWHPAARRSRKNIIEHNDGILVKFLRKI